MKLTGMERLKLLEILPNEGNRLNLKILRKLRESLSFNEEELKHIPVRYEFVCTHQTLNKNGDIVAICNKRGFFSDNPRCAEHDKPMFPTGQMQILDTPYLHSAQKEIYVGEEAVKIISRSLKMLNDINKLTEDTISLYDKFFPPDEAKD